MLLAPASIFLSSDWLFLLYSWKKSNNFVIMECGESREKFPHSEVFFYEWSILANTGSVTSHSRVKWFVFIAIISDSRRSISCGCAALKVLLRGDGAFTFPLLNAKTNCPLLTGQIFCRYSIAYFILGYIKDKTFKMTDILIYLQRNWFHITSPYHKWMHKWWLRENIGNAIQYIDWVKATEPTFDWKTYFRAHICKMMY